MSVIVSTPNQICNHPVNNSKAKMLWTFSKAQKTTAEVRKSNCTQAFYDLPPVKENRTAAFGYGHKYDFTKTASANPSPNTYEIKSLFDKPAKRGFSFGLSREAMAVTGGQYIGEKKSPGPGAYDTRETNKVALSYSFRPRTQTESLTSPRFVPGPGNYTLSATISPKGKYNNSKFKGSGATLFSPAHSKRFYDLKPGFPGPGTYDSVNAIKGDGSYYVSKFHSSMCRTFSHGMRKNATTGSLSVETPGPGSYRLPSEFGHYEGKHQKSQVTVTEPNK